jgi:hypothetical protein
MKMTVIVGLVLLVLGGVLTRSLFPKTIRQVVPPRIVTQYDTVEKLDTAWITREVQKTKWDTVYLERVITARPETVVVSRMTSVTGLRYLIVGEKVGDSTTALGFTVKANPQDSTTILLDLWQTRWWTAGPLRSIATDTFPPRISFYPAPEVSKNCGWWCKTKLVLASGGVGYGVCTLAQ